MLSNINANWLQNKLQSHSPRTSHAPVLNWGLLPEGYLTPQSYFTSNTVSRWVSWISWSTLMSGRLSSSMSHKHECAKAKTSRLRQRQVDSPWFPARFCNPIHNYLRTRCSSWQLFQSNALCPLRSSLSTIQMPKQNAKCSSSITARENQRQTHCVSVPRCKEWEFVTTPLSSSLQTTQHPYQINPEFP